MVGEGLHIKYILLTWILISNLAHGQTSVTCAVVASIQEHEEVIANAPSGGYLARDDYDLGVKSYLQQGLGRQEAGALSRFKIERDLFVTKKMTTIFHDAYVEVLDVKTPEELVHALDLLDESGQSKFKDLQANFITNVADTLRTKFPPIESQDLAKIEKTIKEWGMTRGQYDRLQSLLYDVDRAGDLEEFILGTILAKDGEFIDLLSAHWTWAKQTALKLKSILTKTPDTSKADQQLLDPVAEAKLTESKGQPPIIEKAPPSYISIKWISYRYGRGREAWTYLIKNRPEWIVDFIKQDLLDLNVEFWGNDLLKMSPQLWALRSGDSELIELLIQKGLSFNGPYSLGPKRQKALSRIIFEMAENGDSKKLKLVMAHIQDYNRALTAEDSWILTERLARMSLNDKNIVPVIQLLIDNHIINLSPDQKTIRLIDTISVNGNQEVANILNQAIGRRP